MLTTATLAAVAALLYFAFRGNGGGQGPPAPDAPAPPGVPADVWRWRPVLQDLHSQLQAPLTVPLWLAMVWQESSGDPGAVGGIGEKGLLQLTQGALDDVRSIDNATHLPSSVSDLTPAQNLEAGMRYGKINARRRGDGVKQSDIIRMHNGGPNGHQMEETKAYATRVIARAERLSE